MWQFLWASSEGSVSDEEHPSELRYLGYVGVICFADELRLNLNLRAQLTLPQAPESDSVGLTERAGNRRKSVVTGILILSDVLKLSTHERLLLANRIHETATLFAVLVRLTRSTPGTIWTSAFFLRARKVPGLNYGNSCTPEELPAGARSRLVSEKSTP